MWLSIVRRIFLLVVLIPFFNFAYQAQSQNFNDVSIVRGQWVRKTHAESSFVAYENYLKTKRQMIKEGDFYTSLLIVPKLQKKEGECSTTSATPSAFLRGFLGTSETSMSLTTLSATKGQGALGDQEFLKSLVLFYAGKGFEPSTKTPSANSCFFDYYRGIQEPYIRYEPGTNQDISLDFRITRSKKLESKAIATLNDSITAAAAAFSLTGVSGVAVPSLERAAANLQAGINSNFSRANTITVTKTLSPKVDAVYYLSSIYQPNSSGRVTIYLRKSSSMILDTIGETIDYESVRGNSAVGVSRCLPNLPASGDASCVTPKTFKEAFKEYRGAKEEFRFFQINDKEKIKSVFSVCDDIRFFASGKLRLSTLDALLVRWAAVKEDNLDQALKNPSKRAEIASASGVDGQRLDKCWNKIDEETLLGVAKQMKKRLEL